MFWTLSWERFDHHPCFKHLQGVISQKWHVIHSLTNVWPERPVYRLGGLGLTQDINKLNSQKVWQRGNALCKFSNMCQMCFGMSRCWIFTCLNLQIPAWGESTEEGHRRFSNTFFAVADKFPCENVLCVSHGKSPFIPSLNPICGLLPLQVYSPCDLTTLNIWFGVALRSVSC